MARRRHICDVPGCGKDRLRWQRLCTSCYGRLPGNIRQGLIDAYAQKRLPAWRTWKREAALFLQHPHECPAIDGPRVPAVTPQRAQELQARMLGERPDA